MAKTMMVTRRTPPTVWGESGGWDYDQVQAAAAGFGKAHFAAAGFLMVWEMATAPDIARALELSVDDVEHALQDLARVELITTDPNAMITAG